MGMRIKIFLNSAFYVHNRRRLQLRWSERTGIGDAAFDPSPVVRMRQARQSRRSPARRCSGAMIGR